jgi:magnesium chelatase subunit D
MAINRIAQAKGALTRLLQGAYLHRDQVALVSFRRETAEVLLTPTRSVELAKRLTEAIPAGGGTPLAAGIAKALEVARSAKLRGMPQAMLVLFTDGRANVKFAYRGSGSPTTISDELRQLGVLLHKEDVKTVVIDTQSKYIGRDEGKAVAELLGARYFSLSRSDAKSMYQAITSAAELHRDV